MIRSGILQSEADLAYQENELRNTRLSMEHEHLRLKQDRIGLSKELVQKERRFRQYERLYKKNLLAREDYLQAEEDYEAALGQLAVVDERIKQDDLFRSSQLQSLDENIRNMKKSLALVRGRLENLKVKAPVDGQLGNLEAQIGFALQDADVQERVTEAEDHVARPHLRPFLDQAFFDAPTLDGVKIDDTIRQYLPDNPDVVVELSFLHGSDRNAFFLHFQGRGSITKKKPKQAKQPDGNSYQGIDVFLLKPGLPLNTGVHAIDCHSCCIYSVPKNEPVR